MSMNQDLWSIIDHQWFRTILTVFTTLSTSKARSVLVKCPLSIENFFKQRRWNYITTVINAKRKRQLIACFTSNWLKSIREKKFKNFRIEDDSNVRIVSKSIFQMMKIFFVHFAYRVQYSSFKMTVFTIIINQHY